MMKIYINLTYVQCAASTAINNSLSTAKHKVYSSRMNFSAVIYDIYTYLNYI